MFNYLVTGLGTGATLVLFDGSPLWRPELLWDMAEELRVTVFGTSAKYLGKSKPVRSTSKSTSQAYFCFDGLQTF